MNKTVPHSSVSMQLDNTGSPVAVVKLDPAKAYVGVPPLLQRYINDRENTAWDQITARIDYIYENIDYIMMLLDQETGFITTVKNRVDSGKRLFFKPNVVSPMMLDPVTHGAGMADSACTEWTVIAGLMRWFHDKLDVPYYRMAIGEAASALSMLTGAFNRAGYGKGKPLTTESVLEGRSGDFYGGWQFYFVRRYLQDRHPASHNDDPMNGYKESVDGRYLAPGEAGNRLMVYDLNRIENPDKGREIPVPGGVNFKNLTIHKAVIGGDPADTVDIKKYPGCVLINVPKLKIHSQDLITNAIKNLGIGLYPMELPRKDGKNECDWVYASHCVPAPTLKSEIPHTPWVPEMDDRTILPLKNKDGSLKLKRTGGMPGTQTDIIRAVQNQGIYVLHFSEAIEAVNINHTGNGTGVKVPEGLMSVSLNCVAMDLFAARYMIKTIPIAEARKYKEQRRLPGEFMHRVPVAKIEGQNIVTDEDIDSPLFRYGLYDYAEQRGVGDQAYYIIGKDMETGCALGSIGGHLIRIQDGSSNELMTQTMYYNPTCFFWDMQKTALSYLGANDRLFKTNLVTEAMRDFDENGDGVIDYDENGRRGFWTPVMRVGTYTTHVRSSEKYGALKGPFLALSYMLRFSRKDWNPRGYDFVRDSRFVTMLATAFALSRVPMENRDPFNPDMSWGNGNWPSWQLINHISNTGVIYGAAFPNRFDLLTLYGCAFQYADKILNNGQYSGQSDLMSTPQSLSEYLAAVAKGKGILDFTLYVPAGYGNMGQFPVPNVKETDDPVKILTASFDRGRQIWTSDFNIG